MTHVYVVLTVVPQHVNRCPGACAVHVLTRPPVALLLPIHRAFLGAAFGILASSLSVGAAQAKSLEEAEAE